METRICQFFSFVVWNKLLFLENDILFLLTYPNLLHTVSFSKVTTVNSDIAVAFGISYCRLTPLNIIKTIDTLNCSASTASSENCQYVMVSWSVYDCVATYTCERNSIQKHLYLFTIEPIKRYVTICGGLCLSILVCGCGYLSTYHNEETIKNLQQLTH